MKDLSARLSYDSGKPLRAKSPRCSSTAFGSRKPSGVTSSTGGEEGQRASISRSTRAVVDLPTATEPAMPMTKGVRDSRSPRKALVAAWREPTASEYSVSSRERGRYIWSTSRKSIGSPRPRTRRTSSAVKGRGVESARADHSARVKEINGLALTSSSGTLTPPLLRIRDGPRTRPRGALWPSTLVRMCGIVGYVGSGGPSARAEAVVMGGLERLEYRGYDSAGVAVVTSDREHLAVAKKAGKL